MFNTITYQIKKLDQELDGCKQRLHALNDFRSRKSHLKCSPNKHEKDKRGRTNMNRKIMQAERDVNVECKKHKKTQRKVPDDNKNTKVNSISPSRKKNQSKIRSRSVSGGRECTCDCANENYFHNELDSKCEEHTHKSSWANILKEYNKPILIKNSSNIDKDGYFNKKKMDSNNPISVYLKNRGVQCSESSFIPSKTNFFDYPEFVPYNPTRTLQFQMSEIRENLKHKRVDKVLSIVKDMEDTLYRLRSDNEYNTNYNPVFKEVPLNNHFYSNQDINMNKIFEDGFSKLETTCKTLEVTCVKLKEENKQLQLELQNKNAQISLLEKKEKDNITNIDTLNKHILQINQKGNQYTESIQDLTKLLMKLQQQNKSIEPLKEANVLLESKVKQLCKEKDEIIFENQLLKLEKEKFKVLSEIKEKQLVNYKELFCGLENNVKKEMKSIKGKFLSEEFEGDISAPICSSPNTSGSVLSPAFGSWHKVSRVSTNPGSSSPPISDLDNDPSQIDLLESSKQFVLCDRPQENVFLGTENECVNQIVGTQEVRYQMKKIFAKHETPVTSRHHQNVDKAWTNMQSVHSSVTSYNTTS